MSFNSSHEALASIWTIWALLLFAGIVLWALRPANRERFERDAQIPLDEE